MRVVLVGEVNPFGSEPRFALWPRPAHASGARLMRILGLRERTYVGLTRINLCTSAWSLSEARTRASKLIGRVADGGVVVGLGRKVAMTFRVTGPMFSVHVIGKARFVSLPHPGRVVGRGWIISPWTMFGNCLSPQSLWVVMCTLARAR